MVQVSTKQATMRVVVEEDLIRVGVEAMGQTVEGSVKAPGEEDSTKTAILVMVKQMLEVLTR